jgi:hypothetical protein
MRMHKDPEAEIKRLNNVVDFMGRKLSFMIPKVRVDEQIQLDEFEIGAVVTWHNKMIDKCERENLTDRAEYHRTRAAKLNAILRESDSGAA